MTDQDGWYGSASSTTYTFNCDIDKPSGSLERMKELGYHLYGFKAVGTATGGGTPLLWFDIPPEDLGWENEISWTVDYKAYMSTTTIKNGAKIVTMSPLEVDLGDEYCILNSSMPEVRRNKAPKTQIRLKNEYEGREYACGISQSMNGGPASPICALPVAGKGAASVQPIEKLVVLVATSTNQTATAYTRSYASGAWIDLTGADKNQRDLVYKLNYGFQIPSTARWAEEVEEGDNLLPILMPGAPASDYEE